MREVMNRESDEAWSEIEEKEGWGGRVSPLRSVQSLTGLS